MLLDARQRRIVEAIRVLSREQGEPPTPLEIGRYVGIADRWAIVRHLIDLSNAGVVTYTPDVLRSVRVIVEQDVLGG